MTSRDFCYWLQGHFELNGCTMSNEQAEIVQRHLNMVFLHEIDPSMGDKPHQDALQGAHDGKPPKPPKPPFQGNNTLIKC